jgi:hypothetical protein
MINGNAKRACSGLALLGDGLGWVLLAWLVIKQPGNKRPAFTGKFAYHKAS